MRASGRAGLLPYTREMTNSTEFLARRAAFNLWVTDIKRRHRALPRTKAARQKRFEAAQTAILALPLAASQAALLLTATNRHLPPEVQAWALAKLA